MVTFVGPLLVVDVTDGLRVRFLEGIVVGVDMI